MSRKKRSTSWDPLAKWYDGWVGAKGSSHHQDLAIPAVMDALNPQPGEHILDVGAGQGVLAPYIAKAKAGYVGVDLSPSLIDMAIKRHGRNGFFVVGDARRLHVLEKVSQGKFAGVVFLLSIQDMDPLEDVIDSAVWALKPGGRLVILMTHPCFRVPRQSGWGFDEDRKLRYRRVDSYLSHNAVPLKSYKDKSGGRSVTRSFHRPLQAYVNALGARGLAVDYMDEVSAEGLTLKAKNISRSDRRASQEIPLFLCLRARG